MREPRQHWRQELEIYQDDDQASQTERRSVPAGIYFEPYTLKAPPVYRPAPATGAAPAVYRPNFASLLQPKAEIAVPPVYRPQGAIQQPGSLGATDRISLRVAPHQPKPAKAKMMNSVQALGAKAALARFPARVMQLSKGGKKAGTFIGDENKIHLHIDILKPHLMILDARYDISGRDFGGLYSMARCVEALAALTEKDNRGVSGATDCRNWLENLLDGEIIKYGAGWACESQWGEGLIVCYPSKKFEKGH